MPSTERRRDRSVSSDEENDSMRPFDLDDELEEFHRFVRRGEFGAANAFFDQHLKVHIANPWIFAQYAEMLFEMGDYKSLLQLDPEPVFRHMYQGPIDAGSVSTRILEINWELLKASSLRYNQHWLRPVQDDVCEASAIIPVSADVGSTEVRIICLSMQLMDAAKKNFLSTKTLPRDLAKWGDWKSVYRELQAQGRIWDFGDLFTTACACFGTRTTEEQFLGSETIFEALKTDWNGMVVDDESTVLSVVDILSTMAILAITQTEVKPIGEKYLSWANSLVETAISAFPHCIKTRPFLRFMVAQASISLRRGKRSQFAHDHLAGFPGLSVLPPGIDIPYYIPVGKENPGWAPPGLPEGSLEPLEMALKASRELKDYRIEALCLKELAMWGRESSKCLEELTRLQTDRQQDMEGYLATCLSRYLFETNEDAKAKLLRDLDGFGAWRDLWGLISPDKACARDIIQQSLSPLHSTSHPQYVEAGLRHYPWLPEPFKQFIDKHVEKPPRSPIIIPPPPPPPSARPHVSAPQASMNRHHHSLQDYRDANQESNPMRASQARKLTPPQENEEENDLEDPKSPSRPPSSDAPPHVTTTSQPTVEDG
ncbi:hypothetical protein BHE90_000115 [Fusarium euwallaceae]|uniref:Uncharacterized protein n=1 Tax=Fusarium euwallaceae TaxID=1147111 RepID=A0A430MBI7_9HYPO|nr:hypothetical protein BHE90_000115 [Fusarium euwallaceae]